MRFAAGGGREGQKAASNLRRFRSPAQFGSAYFGSEKVSEAANYRASLRRLNIAAIRLST